MVVSQVVIRFLVVSMRSFNGGSCLYASSRARRQSRSRTVSGRLRNDIVDALVSASATRRLQTRNSSCLTLVVKSMLSG